MHPNNDSLRQRAQSNWSRNSVMSIDLFDAWEWLVVRNATTEATAHSLESLAYHIMVEKFGAPEGHRLSDLSDWFVAAETTRPGIARAIREKFKASDAVKEQLATAPMSYLVEGLTGKKSELHHIIRFRTVIRSQDFSHSRPHQDAALWPERSNHINCWLPLCDVGDKLAPLMIVPGSSSTIYPHIENEYKQMEVDSFDQMGFSPIAIKPRFGELVLFSPRVIHFSGPNLTNRVRWSLDFRFQDLPNTGI